MDQSASLSLLTAFSGPVIWAGVVVAFGIAAILAFQRTGRRGDDDPIITLGPSAARLRENSEFWEVLPTRADDRRGVIRREGNPTPVHVVGPDGKKRQSACVLDRNSGGVRIASERAIPVGTDLLLLADASPAGTPWVRATVCWCKSEGHHSEVGCRFSEPIPWNILLLFG